MPTCSISILLNISDIEFLISFVLALALDYDLALATALAFIQVNTVY